MRHIRFDILHNLVDRYESGRLSTLEFYYLVVSCIQSHEPDGLREAIEGVGDNTDIDM